MKIFVTGATGFIGSYLVKILLLQGHELMCLRRKTSNLFRLSDENISKITWVYFEDNFYDEVLKFMPEAIFNLAWNGVAAKDRINWGEQVSNIIFQQKLLDLALEVKCKKFIGVGSQAEYGDFDFKIEENHPVNPKNAYAATKAASLIVLKTFCEQNNINWYWFRVFPVFGPYEAGNWLIPSLIKSICESDSMNLTKGEQCLPYLYVGECALAMASSINADGNSGIYNICSDNPIQLRDLAIKIKNIINPSFILNFGALNYRPGQSMYMVGDTNALNEKLYKIDTTHFEEQLQDTIRYYLQIYKNE